ncbi:preprotein translocase subunit SecG [Rugamonas apoptosis]|uniref:Protein-export membrane protein SecG n=1 Tax=Rugamonas apoptosis TaxID=2758570 RepID=A0A7W2FCS6_9BURK|nr:preprotein translocase subunit SecG [Rugamonas apoptosis]MBA5689331.1 preprotein translocase subunit SecG [Rugamonas apoptosis]
MNTLYNLIVVVQVLSALAIIGLVLMQHGKGADMGAAFGSGASGSLFGASGSSNFMSKSTAVAAVLFFSATLGLSFLQTHSSTGVSGGVMDKVAAPAPAAPAGGAGAIPATTAPAAAAPAATAPAAPAPAAPAPAASIPK